MVSNAISDLQSIECELFDDTISVYQYDFLVRTIEGLVEFQFELDCQIELLEIRIDKLSAENVS